MQPAMKNLMTRLTACTSPEEGTAILVQGIAGAIKRAGTDATKLANLHDDLKTNANAWGGAHIANLGEASADIAQDATAETATPPAAASKGRLNGANRGARQATNGAATNGAAAAPAGTPQSGATAKAPPGVAAAAAKANAQPSKVRARKAA